jgi:translation initiation factor eIF-2B subunit delta
VLVCSESYKFSDKVKIDSICYNDLGRPEDLVETSMYDGDKRVCPELAGWRDQKNLLLLNLKYDLTPPEYIDMIITEVGSIPVTSVPVILREFRIDTEIADIDIEAHKVDGIKTSI